jgi:hypothetical protein
VSVGHHGSVCGRFWGQQGTGEVTQQHKGYAAVALRFPVKRWLGLANKRQCKLWQVLGCQFEVLSGRIEDREVELRAGRQWHRRWLCRGSRERWGFCLL